MFIIDINIIVIITAGGGSEGHDLRRLKEVIIRPKIFVAEMILSGGYLWKGFILWYHQVARTENFDVTLNNVTEDYGVTKIDTMSVLCIHVQIKMYQINHIFMS